MMRNIWVLVEISDVCGLSDSLRFFSGTRDSQFWFDLIFLCRRNICDVMVCDCSSAQGQTEAPLLILGFNSIRSAINSRWRVLRVWITHDGVKRAALSSSHEVWARDGCLYKAELHAATLNGLLAADLWPAGHASVVWRWMGVSESCWDAVESFLCNRHTHTHTHEDETPDIHVNFDLFLCKNFYIW